MATGQVGQNPNKLIIQFPNSIGMLYYINNILASDFIHDYRYGGSGRERLNTLANKVEEIRKMIGFGSIQTGGGHRLKNNKNIKKKGGKVSLQGIQGIQGTQDLVIPRSIVKGMNETQPYIRITNAKQGPLYTSNQSDIDDRVEEDKYIYKPGFLKGIPPSMNVNRQPDELDETQTRLDEQVTETETETERDNLPYKEPTESAESVTSISRSTNQDYDVKTGPEVLETSIKQDDLESSVNIEKWQNNMQTIIDKFYSIYNMHDLNLLTNGSGTRGGITEESFMNYLSYNVLYNQTPLIPYSIDIEDKDLNVKKIIQYGNSPLNEKDIFNAKNVLTSIRGEGGEVEGEVVGDIDVDSEILAKAFQTLSFRLDEYVSEFILTTTGYIGTNPINNTSESTSENTNVDENYENELEGQGEGEILIGGVPIPRTSLKQSTQKILESKNRRYEDIRERQQQRRQEMYQGTRIKNSFESVLNSLVLKKMDVGRYYLNTINDISNTIESLPSYREIRIIDVKEQGLSSEDENQQIQEIENDISIESQTLNATIGYLQQSSEMEMNFIDEVIDLYITLYYTQNYTPSESEGEGISDVNIPTFWLPGAIFQLQLQLQTFENIKLFFKIKAELQYIMDHFMDAYLSDAYGRVYALKNRKLLMGELTSIVLNFINSPRIESLGPIMTERQLNDKRSEIVRMFPKFQEELLFLFPQHANYIELIENILINGQWVPINRIDPNLFAVQLLQSSYFKEEVKLIALKYASNQRIRRFESEVGVGVEDVGVGVEDVDVGVEEEKEGLESEVASEVEMDEEIGEGTEEGTEVRQAQGVQEEGEVNEGIKKEEEGKGNFGNILGFFNNLFTGGQYPNLQIDENGCSNANSVLNIIKDKCSSFLTMSAAELPEKGGNIMNEIVGDTETSLHSQLFNSLFPTKNESVNKFYTESRLNVETIFIKEFNEVKASGTKRTGSDLVIKSLKRLNENVSNYYSTFVKNYCSEILKRQKSDEIRLAKQRKQQLQDLKREAAGEINKTWANQLIKYVARASLIITESVIDVNVGDEITYRINEQYLNRLKPSNGNTDIQLKGNWAFYLSILSSLLKEADWLMEENERILNIYLNELRIKQFDLNLLTSGDIDERTKNGSEKILEMIFGNKRIPTKPKEDNNITRRILNKWKGNNKTLINNAVSKWPGALSKNLSFCPMSSINDAQSNCSNYASALKNNELEVADMNVLFQNSDQSLFYNLRYIAGKPSAADCRIIVETYIGNGMDQGLGPIPANLFISKDTNMNIKSQDDDKTLGACNVFANVVQTIKEMWTNMYTSFPGMNAERISELCWDAMLTKYNYFNFLKCSHLKALGDSTQELNGALKYGGYTSLGMRSYSKNTNNKIVNNNISFISDTNRNTISVATQQNTINNGKIEPYDAQGNAFRATLSNDRQAGSRSIWLLTCLPEGVVNSKAFGGYSGPGPKGSLGEFVLAVSDPTMISMTGGKSINGLKTTVKRKYKNNKNSKTRVSVKYTRKKYKKHRSVLKLRENKDKDKKSIKMKNKGESIQKRRKTRRYK
jgi:hypothetical protein